MINEILQFVNVARQSFIGCVILVTVPTIIIGLLCIGLFGKSIPKDECPCCHQKLPEEVK